MPGSNQSLQVPPAAARLRASHWVPACHRAKCACCWVLDHQHPVPVGHYRPRGCHVSTRRRSIGQIARQTHGARRPGNHFLHEGGQRTQERGKIVVHIPYPHPLVVITIPRHCPPAPTSASTPTDASKGAEVWPQIHYLRHSRDGGNPSPARCTAIASEAVRHAARANQVVDLGWRTWLAISSTT